MPLNQHKRAVGVFSNRNHAELALNELRHAGFPMSKISLVARDTRQDDIAGVGITPGNQVGEGAATGAVTGAALGGVIGLVGAISALAIPGIGPVLAGGTLATILGNTIAGGAIGAAAGGLVGALVGIGIPEEHARFYSDRVSHGDYLVMVEGTEQEISMAETILRQRGIQEWAIFSSADVDTTAATAYGMAYPAGLGGIPDPFPTPMSVAAYEVANQHRRAIGVFSRRQDTEYALQELREANFPMGKVSVIARDANRNDTIAGVDVTDESKVDEGATTGAIAGGALGGLTGLLVGLGALTIPGLGPILLAGAGATALATTLAGGAIGAVAGGLIGALIGVGIPEERAIVYSDRVARGGYLVMVDGTEEEIHRAEAILNRRGIEEWGIYHQPMAESHQANYGRAVAPDVVSQPTVTHEHRVVNHTPDVVSQPTVTHEHRVVNHAPDVVSEPTITHEHRVARREPVVEIIDNRQDKSL